MRESKTDRWTDTKAASITTGYIINVGIATLVLSTLILGMQGTFDNIEQTTAATQSEAVAEKIAAEMVQADRLARVDSNSSGTLTLELRDSLGGSDYSVEVTQDYVNISTDSRVTSLGYNITSDVDSSEFSGGGEIDVEYDGEPDPPEVTIIG
jgi:hypothetical protein